MGGAKESTNILDRSGDLVLIVNQAERQKTFRVSSSAMCLASPVWRAMLSHSGNFKEARPKNGEVSFPEDDSDAMFIVLSVVHYQFQNIPKALTKEELLNLAIVCDKYDVTKLLLSWFRLNWLESIGFCDGNSMLIAWLFQDFETFKKLVDEMIRDSELNKEGNPEVGLLKMDHMPPGLLEDIFKARAAGIEALQNAIKRLLWPYSTLSCDGFACSLKKRECDFMISGAFATALADAGWVQLVGNTPTQRETPSMNSLIECLQSISLLPYPGHELCLSTFRAKVDHELGTATGAIPSGYSDVHLAHFGRPE